MEGDRHLPVPCPSAVPYPSGPGGGEYHSSPRDATRPAGATHPCLCGSEDPPLGQPRTPRCHQPSQWLWWKPIELSRQASDWSRPAWLPPWKRNDWLRSGYVPPPNWLWSVSISMKSVLPPSRRTDSNSNAIWPLPRSATRLTEPRPVQLPRFRQSIGPLTRPTFPPRAW